MATNVNNNVASSWRAVDTTYKQNAVPSASSSGPVVQQAATQAAATLAVQQVASSDHVTAATAAHELTDFSSTQGVSADESRSLRSAFAGAAASLSSATPLSSPSTVSGAWNNLDAAYARDPSAVATQATQEVNALVQTGQYTHSQAIASLTVHNEAQHTAGKIDDTEYQALGSAISTNVQMRALNEI